ncbi:hypothetical protein PV726_07325 [Streptomyces europaeiscabiei]|nr:hypothetical protein [Streptomyces europaeiscabiei]
MLSWTGAAVPWLWWHNTPAGAATTADRLVDAGRIRHESFEAGARL